MDLGGGGHFRHMPPLFGEMWSCPNRKMNMHVECAPPFGLEVGVVLSKNKTEKVVAKKLMNMFC